MSATSYFECFLGPYKLIRLCITGTLSKTRLLHTPSTIFQTNEKQFEEEMLIWYVTSSFRIQLTDTRYPN